MSKFNSKFNTQYSELEGKTYTSEKANFNSKYSSQYSTNENAKKNNSLNECKMNKNNYGFMHK